MTTVISECRTGRSLLDGDLFDRLTARVAADERLSSDLAVRIVDQALAFLAACATDHDEPFAPSSQVDLGWHTFILHTKDYARFCHQIAGRFLHHVPTTSSSVSPSDACATRWRTVRAIQQAGFAVDTALWQESHADCEDCHQCHQGCADSPKKK
ncbi:glycine-rich domain-containing protein [Amycolatopsis pigmentata]|uniref:Glycine-rich domain-containing protein n=1 Tax=Amycolatopsis pigmentata TaxID=450801 RepID=A0ABW5FX34_9PSEU